MTSQGTTYLGSHPALRESHNPQEGKIEVRRAAHAYAAILRGRIPLDASLSADEVCRLVHHSLQQEPIQFPVNGIMLRCVGVRKSQYGRLKVQVMNTSTGVSYCVAVDRAELARQYS